MPTLSDSFLSGVVVGGGAVGLAWLLRWIHLQTMSRFQLPRHIRLSRHYRRCR
jgi:hypothetical protein